MNITAGQTFKGTASLGGMTVNIEWSFSSVDNNNFTFSQILTDNDGNQLEDSSGQGSFQANDSTVTLNFEDSQTNFEGTIVIASGLFTGNAAQKDGSANGTFNMTAI